MASDGAERKECPDCDAEHYEIDGMLYCEHTRGAFSFQRGDVECPHCGGSFTVPEIDEFRTVEGVEKDV